jgi:hypothetical protein
MPPVFAPKRFQQLLGILGLASAQLVTGAAEANTGAVPALYATKAEAEAAAKQHFNCTGAHPMGKQWMPCAQHGQASGSAQHQH